MHDDRCATTIETTDVQPRTRTKPPELLPPYAVIVYNDDDHTFEYVIMTFNKVFKYDLRRCALLAQQIHERGSAIVWVGQKEVAELKVEQIRGMGPDTWASKPVNYPLRTEMMPMS